MRKNLEKMVVKIEKKTDSSKILKFILNNFFIFNILILIFVYIFNNSGYVISTIPHLIFYYFLYYLFNIMAVRSLNKVKVKLIKISYTIVNIILCALLFPNIFLMLPILWFLDLHNRIESKIKVGVIRTLLIIFSFILIFIFSFFVVLFSYLPGASFLSSSFDYVSATVLSPNHKYQIVSIEGEGQIHIYLERHFYLLGIVKSKLIREGGWGEEPNIRWKDNNTYYIYDEEYKIK